MVNDDAQREMEQRALRNVRALVDKIENVDDLGRKSSRKWIMVTVVVFSVVLGMLFVVVNRLGTQKGYEAVVIPPPPARTESK